MDALEELIANAALIQQAFNQAFNVDHPLQFKQLKGGVCNAPIYVYYLQGDTEIPLGVFKREVEAPGLVRKRFAMLEEMTARGFAYNPKIIKNREGDCLTQINSHACEIIRRA